MKTGTALRSKGEIKILHAVAGRVRLGFVDSRTKEVTNTVLKQLRQQKVIEEIRINESLNNILILFDANKLSLPRLFSIFQENGIIVTPDRGLASKAEIFPSDALSRVGSGLESLIPPMAGLVTSSWLGMQGWKAIATYLVTSGVTREVIEQLPLELATTTKTEDAQTLVKPLLPKTRESASYSIVHATLGRIRLRVPGITWDCDYARKLEDLLTSNDKISSVRVNRPTGSVVITYHANTFSNNELTSQTRKILANIFEELNSTDAIEALEPLNNEPKQDINSIFEDWEQNRHAEKAPVQEAELIEQEATATNRATQAPKDSIEPMDAAQIGLWSRFKSCMLSMMLKLMANLPVQQPAKI